LRFCLTVPVVLLLIEVRLEVIVGDQEVKV
jgi:hypothetical protein